MRRMAGFVAVLVVLLAGCGWVSSIGSTGEPAEVLEDVEYYYACGNEILELPDGRTFYPLVPQSLGLGEVAAGTAAARVVLAVVAPGPGDDTGTLTVYSDGSADWESDSGIEARLTDEPQTYDFVC